MLYPCTPKYTLPTGMREKAVISHYDPLTLHTYVRAHIADLFKKHKGERGTLEMLLFLKIENVMESVAGDELCLCQTQRGRDQVSTGRAHILLCARTVL